MSFKVLVIPEDPTHDEAILKPLVQKMMQVLGKPSAKIQVLKDPKIDGYGHAKSLLDEIIEIWGFADLILFLHDRDCQETVDESCKTLTKKHQAKGKPFIAQCAWQEIEIWLLALHQEELFALPEFKSKKLRWSDVRNDCSVKENYFTPFLQRYGDAGSSGGRERLMKEGLGKFSSLLTRCPELRTLKTQIGTLLKK